NAETLLHRSGRTGRAGRKGTCVVITPAHRQRVARSILRAARVEARDIDPPGADAIDARYRERILTSPLLQQDVTEEEAENVNSLLANNSPMALAAAYLRLQMAARPVPEEIGAPEPEAPGEPGTRERFAGGTWYRITLGRKQRADPRWLLPMICKAGGVTKQAIGSIRIFDKETIFEVAADKVDAFTRNLEKNGTGERNVTIAPVDRPAPKPPRPPKKKPVKAKDHKKRRSTDG